MITVLVLIQNLVATSELVSQSFIEHLRQVRGDDQASCEARAKRRKIAVAPGKSLSADDIPVPGPSRTVQMHASTVRGKRAGNGVGATSANVDVVDTNKPSSGSKSDYDGSNTSTCSGESEPSASESDITDVEPDDPISATERSGSSNGVRLEINEGEYVIVTYEGHLYPIFVSSQKRRS
jgi:hypothetical protein